MLLDIYILYVIIGYVNSKTRGKMSQLKGINMEKTININLYPNHQQQNEQWVSIAEQLHEAKQMLKYYKAMEQKTLKQLVTLSNEKNSLGGKYVLTMEERLGSVNYKEIPELENVNLDMYRKDPVTSWKLSII